MPRLIVTARELHYAGKTRHCGDVFEASDNDAKVLKLAKRAADAPPPPKPRAVPVREAASVQPPSEASLRIPVELDAPMVDAPPPAPEAPAPAAAEPPTGDAFKIPEPPPAPSSAAYRTRRLKAED